MVCGLSLKELSNVEIEEVIKTNIEIEEVIKTNIEIEEVIKRDASFKYHQCTDALVSFLSVTQHRQCVIWLNYNGCNYTFYNILYFI